MSTRKELVARLLDLFRVQGYDGTSLADVAAATGLGKSSLYHHFPGGKEEMALAVLVHLDELLAPAFAALDGAGTPGEKLAGLLGALDDFYAAGRRACILERLCASVEAAKFAVPLRGAFLGLLGAFERLGREAGVADAGARAEDALVRIEGALVVAAGTGDPAVFGRALERIRGSLLLG